MKLALAKYLMKETPLINASDLADIVKIILTQPQQRPIHELAASIVATENLKVGPLISSLSRCQWQRVQSLVEVIDSEDRSSNLTDFSHAIESIAGLQSAIIAAYDDIHKNTDNIKITHILSQSRPDWRKKGAVHLHNYFHEMPITAKATFVNSSGNKIEILASPEVAQVFSASTNMHDALITSIDEQYVFKVSGRKSEQNTLSLFVHDITKLRQELRDNIRVQSADDITLILKTYTSSMNIMMRDISSTGIGLELKTSYQIHTGETVGLFWQLDDNKMYMESIVCWETNSGHLKRAGIKFTSPGIYEEIISKFIFSQQQKRIAVIKGLASPDWIKNEQ